MLRKLHETHGCLTILNFIQEEHLPKTKRLQRVLCRCVCGKEMIYLYHQVINRKTSTCHCEQKKRQKDGHKTHGLCHTKCYYRWSRMLQFCYNHKNKKYPNYGGRGIEVCERWKKLENFYADMGNPPTEKHTINRINNDGNYCPENCEWVTPKEQANNKTNNQRFTYKGKTQTLQQWAEEVGIDHQTLHARLLLMHWPIEEALFKPIDPTRHKKNRPTHLTFKGETKIVKEWAEFIGVKYKTLFSRLYVENWPLEKALTQKLRKVTWG